MIKFYEESLDYGLFLSENELQKFIKSNTYPNSIFFIAAFDKKVKKEEMKKEIIEAVKCSFGEGK